MSESMWYVPLYLEGNSQVSLEAKTHIEQCAIAMYRHNVIYDHFSWQDNATKMRFSVYVNDTRQIFLQSFRGYRCHVSVQIESLEETLQLTFMLSMPQQQTRRYITQRHHEVLH